MNYRLDSFKEYDSTEQLNAQYAARCDSCPDYYKLKSST